MKKAKVPSLVAVMILTLITISFWIIFSVVRIFQKETSPSLSPEILNPLNSNYDKTVVDKIEKRIYFDKGQVFEVAQPSPVPTDIPAPSPEPSPESATDSGAISP